MRECAYPPCHRPPRGRGRFCSDAHRWAEWDHEHPRINRTTAPRRLSRDGLGAKVYLSDAEIMSLLYPPTFPTTPGRESAVEKLRAALDRIARRKETA